MFIRRTLKILTVAALVIGVGLACLRYRPNGSDIHPDLVFEHWPAVANEWHNSNTDMIQWNGAFYMVHAQSPFHFASPECVLVVHKSTDKGKTWEKLAEVNVPGEDVRDPKLAIFGDELFMYVLKNTEFAAEPYTTELTTTRDGVNWTPLESVGHEGWLFWRPKSTDGETWYLPAYWHDHGRSILLQSQDGRNWEEVSESVETSVSETAETSRNSTWRTASTLAQCTPIGSLKCRVFGVGKIVGGHLMSDATGLVSGAQVT